jgi:hypothetical protein
MFGTAEFGPIQTDVFGVWNTSNETDPFSSPGMVQQMQAQFNLTVDGQHYFVDQNSTLEAVWDLTSSGQFATNPGAIVFAHKVQTAPSPDGPNNIPWVELKADSGQLADTIYRVNTVQGQPPGSVSSSVDWCLSCSINLIFFIVFPQQFIKCQVCRKILYVYMR